MNIFDKVLYKMQGAVMSAPKKLALNQFRKSIPKGLESGKIKWREDLDVMANEIIDMTGQGNELRGIVGITIEDIKEILVEIKQKE